MPIRVGLLAEGNDHLILVAFLAKLLGVAEEELLADVIDGQGHGWQYVERTVDRALRRFYGGCAQLAILSMDDDGDLDLIKVGGSEDPKHPRHWLHAADGPKPGCRWCLVKGLAEKTRPHLNWIPQKPGDGWPIVIALPVESIEAWLLTTQAIVSPGSGSLHAEREARSTFKLRFYRRPAATRTDVETVALPMIRQLSHDQLQVLGDHSTSFKHFAGEVDRFREEIQTAPDCWS